MKPSTFFKSMQWQDKAVCIILIFFTIFYGILFSSFNQFPSEYYGGDHYAHFASALKIYNTYNPFISAQYLGELQHYPWLTQFLIALVAKISFIDILTVGIYFPILILIATIIITYIFGKMYFENKTWALILSLTWAVQLVPAFHPSEFAKQLMIPLLAIFALLLYQINKDIEKKKVLIAGIIFGLAGLQHLVTFIVAGILFFFILLQKIISGDFTAEKAVRKKWCLIFCVGIAIALLFWAPLLLKYQGNTLNDWQIYTSESVMPTEEAVRALFTDFVFGAGIRTTATIIFLIAFVGFIWYGVKNKETKIFIPLLLFVAALLGYIHPYLTYPTLGMSLGYYRFPIVLVFVKHLILITGLFYIWKQAEKRTEKQFSKKTTTGIFLLLFTGIAIFSFINIIEEYKSSDRYAYATEDSEKIKAYNALREYLDEKGMITEEDVVITTHPDVGFFFNAMTGENVMTTRVTHGSPFVDHNKRTADMAVILFGTNRTKAKELMKEYQVTYAFLETQNIEFKALCNQRWNETVYGKKEDKTTAAYWCLQTDPMYNKYLEENGIETATAKVRLAAGDKDVPLKKVLVVEQEDIVLKMEAVYQYFDKEGNLVVELYKITE
ncbi:hypothetical protein HZC31_06385 [Candidatus Woesearchaeota archaeon]|nr:hypothetical protein [Candidatus Woesearchaeota archaeon]